MIRVFRALDGLSSVSGAKIMTKKTQNKIISLRDKGDFPN